MLDFALPSYSGNIPEQRCQYPKQIKLHCQLQVGGLASLILAASCLNETNRRFIGNVEIHVIGEVLPLNVDFKVAKLLQAVFGWTLGFIKSFLVEYTV